MGVFNSPMRVASLDGRQSREVEAVVNTGVTYTMLPAGLLREMGIAPSRKAAFECADGRRGEMDVGEVQVTINGSTAVTPVAFGEEGAEPLIGAVTLNALLLAVDPAGNRLIPARAFLPSFRPVDSGQFP